MKFVFGLVQDKRLIRIFSGFGFSGRSEWICLHRLGEGLFRREGKEEEMELIQMRTVILPRNRRNLGSTYNSVITISFNGEGHKGAVSFVLCTRR